MMLGGQQPSLEERDYDQRFSALFAGHVDLDDIGQDATP